MGVILQVALRPLVLGAGRLQRGAARAGARPRHGMCAEQADLATRLHHRHGRATSRKTALFSCGWAPLGSRSVLELRRLPQILLVLVRYVRSIEHKTRHILLHVN